MDEEKRKSYRMLASLSAVGFTLVFATVIGLYCGIKIDQWLDTSPWFTAVFFLLGVIAGFKNLFRYAKQNQDGSDKGGNKKL